MASHDGDKGGDAMRYGDYLLLDRILDAQRPLSDAHDEMLFIIQHQTSELWMRLAIHELNAARDAIGRDAFDPAFKTLARVSRIFEQLNNAWDVLRTMTPAEYARFRTVLGQSSGFQSAQYRMIEFIVGNRDMRMIAEHAARPETEAALRGEAALPSLYDAALGALSRAGLPLSPAVLGRDPHAPYVPSAEVSHAWAAVYRDPERYWPLYDLAEKLVDFEDYFRRWRFNHVTTVERIIGSKPGTGGTAGVAYLRRVLDRALFPELWMARAEI